MRSAALRSGIPVRSFQSVLDGQRPSIERAAEVCEAIGLRFCIGPEGGSPTGAVHLPPRGKRHVGPPHPGGRGGAEVVPWPIPEAGSKRGLSPVGCQVFGQSFLSRFGLNPLLCVSFRMIGDDSMSPTLPEGSAVLADEQRRVRKEGHLYMVYLSGHDLPTVRRAGRDGKGWLLQCDNPQWADRPWGSDIDLVGRVVWTGRVLFDKSELK